MDSIPYVGGLLNGRQGFGPRLRAQRERRGITLTSIAESTKIKRSLLEALERGDVSQWPRGLFRRAYIRDYACAIGLPPEPLVEEFGLLFPENGSTDDRRSAEPVEPFRLTLAAEPKRAIRLASRARRAAIEAGVVLVVAGILALATSITFPVACGAVALIYYPITAALIGRTPDPDRMRAVVTRRRKPSTGASLGPQPETPRIFVVADSRSTALPFGGVGDELPQHHTSH